MRDPAARARGLGALLAFLVAAAAPGQEADGSVPGADGEGGS